MDRVNLILENKRFNYSTKKIVIVFIFLFGIIPLYSQKDYSPIVLYWKTLSAVEKETYLFAYLTQIYDTHTSLIEEKGYGELTKWYFTNRAELAYNILDEFDRTDITKFIGWIDDFYSQEEYKDKPFHEALLYAYTYSQMKGESLLEKYESLLGQPSQVEE